MLNKLLEHYGLEEDSVDILKNNNKICEICDKRCGITYSAKNVNDKIEYNDNYPCNEDVTYFERQGIKFNDYIELLTNFHDEQFQSEDDYEFELYEFSIDGIKVVIDHPSELFEEFVDFSHDDMYANEWFYTISLRGITDDNYNEYLEKVLFVLKYYNDSVVWPFDFKCDKFYGEDDLCVYADEDYKTEIEKRRKYDNRFKDLKFDNIKYHEVIAFYNAGENMSDGEMAFQYYYKVLEYFFSMCQQPEFIVFINEYNNNGKIDDFIKNISKICAKNEREQIKKEINYLASETTQVIHEAFVKNFIKTETTDEFAEELYNYRNSLVHGKREFSLDLKIPNVIQTDKELFWNSAIKRIALILIEKFCLK